MKYDANSLIYISKAMDLFDLTEPALLSLGLVPPLVSPPQDSTDAQGAGVLQASSSKSHPPPPNQAPHLPELAAGLAPLANTPILVLGVQSDILFTVDQQRDIADALRMTGNAEVRYYELGGVWGHDTFL